jgi:hypothetical protein
LTLCNTFPFLTRLRRNDDDDDDDDDDDIGVAIFKGNQEETIKEISSLVLEYETRVKGWRWRQNCIFELEHRVNTV